MHRLVIFGATGLIGQALRTECQNHNLPCFAPSRAEIDLLKPAVSNTLLTVLNPSDHVIFLAAQPHRSESELICLRNNIQMVVNLADAISQRPVEHLLYISSDGVYSPSRYKISENSAVSAADCYRAGHLVREAILKKVCEKNTLCILRSTQVYGGNDTHLAYGPCKFVKTAFLEKSIGLFGNGEEVRDHIAAQDLASLCLKLSERGVAGVLNAATGESTSFLSIAEKLQSMLPFQINLTKSERRQSFFHRRFNINALLSVVPEFKPRCLTGGLYELIAEEQKRNTREHAVKAAFLDRDGVINAPDLQKGKAFAPRKRDKFTFYKCVPNAVAKLRSAGYLIVIVTNQPDLGHNLIDPDDLSEMHHELQKVIQPDLIQVCPHKQNAGCGCRKPDIGMLVDASLRLDIDLASSVMFGDRASDIECGIRAGCATVFLDRNYKNEELRYRPSVIVKSKKKASDVDDNLTEDAVDTFLNAR